MNCEEFLRQFREALDGKVPESVIQDNVNYYRSYINGQTAGGRSESDVLRMLGEPRLLAKTIEESSKFASESRDSREYANFSSARNTDNEYTETVNEKHGRLPGWVITCIVMVVILLVLSVVFRMFVFLAPYIMIFLLAGFLVRAVSNWWHRR